MTLRLIHTADWQLGKPFGNFAADLAGELTAARLEAIDRIAAVARDTRATIVLVAGDVFDSPDLPAQTVRRALERLASQADVTWMLLPGNHDPARAGGIWDRIARYGMPENVRTLTVPQPVALSADAVLLPAPLRNDSPGEDPSGWMDGAPTPAGTMRIGLAHGPVVGFGSEGRSVVTIAQNRAETAGLSYLAMGDWHGVRSVTPRCWYSGTPEPDRFPDNEPGFVLSVSIAGPGAPAAVERVRVGQYTWVKSETAVRTAADLGAVEQSFAALASGIRHVLYKLTLTGSLSLADHARLADWSERWAPRLRHLEIDTRGLAAAPDAGDFDTLSADTALAEAAKELSRMAADPANPERAAASLALVRLYGFAAEVQREGLA